VWAAQENKMLASLLVSVTMTLDSPVILGMTRKGTPARWFMLPRESLRSRGPRTAINLLRGPYTTQVETSLDVPVAFTCGLCLA
jgi:hypothetical protein